MRISDWSSDVCSSDLAPDGLIEGPVGLDDKVMDSRLVGIDRDACHQIRMLNAGPGPGPIRPREGPAVGQDMHRGIRQVLATEFQDAAETVPQPGTGTRRVVGKGVSIGVGSGCGRESKKKRE